MGLITDKINRGVVLLKIAKQSEHKEGTSSHAEGPYFPPNMISKCKREIVYHLLRLPAVLVEDPQMLRVFENGNAVHERLLRYLAADGSLWRYEWPVEDKENKIKGIIDAIIKLSEEEYDLIDKNNVCGRPYLIAEFKSARTEACYNMERYNKPLKRYVEQIQLYMHITGIHKGVILVERKDDQFIYEFYIDYDGELVTELLEKVRYCLNCADLKELPPREGTRKSAPCWYVRDKKPSCPYYDICWSETEGYELIGSGHELLIAVGEED